jgi:hypothetical protein
MSDTGVVAVGGSGEALQSGAVPRRTDPTRRCPVCGAHPTGASWTGGSLTATLVHLAGCPYSDSQWDTDGWWW